jgi:N,N-dimethylformamidase
MLRSRKAAVVMVAITLALAGPALTLAVSNLTRYVPDEPLPAEAVGPQESLDTFGISGYPDKISVEPGESVRIMVSTKAERFRSTMVRVTHGDADPIGPGVKEEVIDTPVNGTYAGRDQRLPLGSYVTVPDDSQLRLSGGFTLTAWIAPTTIPGSPYNRTALQRTPVGTPRPQGILTKWSERRQRGYGLFIDEQGSLALRLGSGGETETVSTGVKLKPWAPGQGGAGMFTPARNPLPNKANESGWYFVAATYDAAAKRVTLTQQPVTKFPEDSATTVSRSVTSRAVDSARVPLLMAAYWDRLRDAHPTGFYNGKIESPKVYDRALSPSEIKAISRGETVPGATAAWDFTRRMATDRVVDTAPGRLSGRAVNLPVRALTSHDWDQSTMNYNEDPEQWGAMYFHEDDLGDARWRPSFTFRVPEDARSGAYAARLEAGDDVYHATFFVRPKEPTSKIAMLVPTFTYQAYAPTSDVAEHGRLLSQYSDHADGSGYVYSSLLRPVTELRPLATGPNGEGRPWAFEADTHIFDWLETKGYEVDYITDHDLHREGRALLDDYQAVITGTHPEYISEAELNALEQWLTDGGRLLYLGGNGFYWITSLDRTGTYTELRRHDGTEAWQAAPGEFYHSTTGEYGGLWRHRGRPPQELVGVGFAAQGFGHPTGRAEYNRPFDRTEASRTPAGAWVFEGVSTETGIGGDMPTLQSPGGPMGEEVDRVDYVLGTPANAVVLGTSQRFGDEYLLVIEEDNTTSLWEGGADNPLVRGDVTLVHYPNGGAAFSAASMVWSGGFFHNNYDNDMTRITENVLDRFASGEPLPGAG